MESGKTEELIPGECKWKKIKEVIDFEEADDEKLELLKIFCFKPEVIKALISEKCRNQVCGRKPEKTSD